MNILIGLLMILLVLVSIVLVFIVLMQRGSANGGLGAAMGGGAAESALGADSGDVLSRATTKVAVVFFVLVLGLNLLILGTHSSEEAAAIDALPEFEVPADSATDNSLKGVIEEAINTVSEQQAAEVEDKAAEAANEAADSLPVSTEN